MPKIQKAVSTLISDIGVYPQLVVGRGPLSVGAEIGGAAGEQPVFVVAVFVVITEPAMPAPTLTRGGVIESCQIPPPKENCTPRLATLYPTFRDNVVNGPWSCCTKRVLTTVRARPAADHVAVRIEGADFAAVT